MLILRSFTIDDYNDPLMRPDVVFVFYLKNPELQIPRHVTDDIVVTETTRGYHIERYRHANIFQVGVVDRTSLGTSNTGSENEWSRTCECWTDRPQ
jgi:hypothetical protein